MSAQRTHRRREIPAREALVALQPHQQPARPLAKANAEVTYTMTALIALLMGVTAAAGLVTGKADPASAGVTVSAAGTLVPGFFGHDLFNLLIATPLLFAAAWYAHKGSVVSLLSLPGALFYVVYTYLQYSIAAPFTTSFPAHIGLVVLSACTLAMLLGAIDGEAVRERLAGTVPSRLLVGTMLGLGALTLAQDGAGALMTALDGVQTEPLARHVWIADLTLEVPAVVIGGVLLWRGAALGYLLATGVFLQFGMTPLAIASIMAAQPLLTGWPVDVPTLVALLIFAVICFGGVTVIARGLRQKPPLRVVANHPQGRRAAAS
jgi:hypothetical protein